MDTHQHSHLWPGVPLALGSAALFGVSAPLSKVLLGATDPWLLAGIMYLGAGLGLAALQAGRRILQRPSGEARLKRHDIPWLAAIVLFGGILGPLLLMFGLAHTAAASASLLLNLESIASLGIAWLVFRENVDRRLLIGAVAILSGAVILSWSGGAGLDAGGLMIAAACLCWGIDNNLTRKLSAADPVQIATIKGLAAGATNSVLALSLGARLPTLDVVAGAAVLGLLAIGISLVMFMLALRHLGTARTGAYFALAPFLGAVVSLVIFNEQPSLQLAMAGLLMALGLWLHLSERHDHEHEHEAIEHDHAHVHDSHHQHTHDGPVTEPHSHPHRHRAMRHSHPHYPDLHHRHRHG